MNRIYGMLGRRSLLQIASIGGFGLAANACLGMFGAIPPAAASEQITEPLSPDAALKKLLDGNQRFRQQKREYPHQASKRLQEVAQAQHPVVTVLSCADSRVPPEIIFDQGIGDLFDVRIAGNIVTPESLGSIEYAAALLGTPLILVLGHERCGAVTAAVQKEDLPGQIGSFVKAIAPATSKVKKLSVDPVEDLVVANVQYQVEKLRRDSNLLAQLERSGKLKIVGGRYDLDAGEVTIIT